MIKRPEKIRSIDYEVRIKQYRHKVIRNIIIILLILIGVALFMLNRYINKIYGSYEILNTVERTDSSTVNYVEYGNGNILKYSRDGVTAISASGKALWNSSYEMKNPIVDICGEYCAVADMGSKEVYVYDGKGKGTHIEVLNSITQIEVASQGVVAVLTQEDKAGDNIYIYNPYDTDNPLIYEFSTNVNKNGYPIQIALSDDGAKMVTSYIKITKGVAENFVTFYNLIEVGKNKVDRIVGGFSFEQTIIPKIEFVTNDIACVYKENGFLLYKMKQIPAEICNITFEEEIVSVFSNENYVGFVLMDKEEDKKSIAVYNLSGKKIMDRKLDYKYDNIITAENEIIFYSALECAILKLNGVEKFRYNFDKSIAYIFPVNERDKYVIIDDTSILEIKLQGDKK